MPVEELGVRVLARLAGARYSERSQRPNRLGTIATWVVEWERQGGSIAVRSETEILQARVPWSEALAEAWDWLHHEGLLAQAIRPWSNPDAYFVTRQGQELLEEDDPFSLLRARRRLGFELHPHLEGRLRQLTRAGAFEQAAFDALREVEVRVRDLAGDPRKAGNGARLVGADLMRHAFRDSGPLADPAADRGSRWG